MSDRNNMLCVQAQRSRERFREIVFLAIKKKKNRKKKKKKKKKKEKIMIAENET